jgi:hypothetical protein
MATASMVVGIVALTTGWFCMVTFLGAPVALILGIISVRRIKESQGRLVGRGMAIAGIATGGVGLALGLAFVAYFVFILVALSNYEGY